jgi:hypothetical protein
LTQREILHLAMLEIRLKRIHIFVPELLKFLRQTGAGSLVWSGAVRDNRPVLGNPRQVLFEFL